MKLLTFSKDGLKSLHLWPGHISCKTIGISAIFRGDQRQNPLNPPFAFNLELYN